MEKWTPVVGQGQSVMKTGGNGSDDNAFRFHFMQYVH